ncbi:MAG: Gfo/Idh/MocA family oxidoreductase [Chloroflexi bacterium]|nr:Gfo/Idh/MocA family oxidoreductase [Chloroflexota bacterium]
MPEQLRVASIGDAGHFNLAAAFGTIRGVKYAAAASDGYGEARVLLAGAAIPVFERGYLEMLDQVRPDVATLGCWYAHNGEVALECLRRGIHVITDKPALNSWAQLAEAEALCAANPSLCFITEFASRMNPAFRAAREAVRSGRIGQPVLVTAQKSYRFGTRPDFFKKRAHFAGLVMWVASHAIDYASWASGLGYLSFQGWQGNLSRPEYGEMEDHVALLARMEGGVAATLTADYLRPAMAPSHGDDRLRIAGTRGIVEVVDEVGTLLSNDAEPQVIGRGPTPPLAVANEYVATLMGEGSGFYSTAETLRMARFLLAARDAADTGQLVQVPSPQRSAAARSS